jgi:hypothetical protein
MLCLLKTFVILSSAAGFNWAVLGAVSAAEVIDDSPLEAAQLLADVPLVGYRLVPQDALVLADPRTNEWVLDASVIYATAANDSEFLEKSGASSNSVKNLPLSRVAPYFEKRQLAKSKL